jgi:hypothetical protein
MKKMKMQSTVFTFVYTAMKTLGRIKNERMNIRQFLSLSVSLDGLNLVLGLVQCHHHSCIGHQRSQVRRFATWRGTHIQDQVANLTNRNRPKAHYVLVRSVTMILPSG